MQVGISRVFTKATVPLYYKKSQEIIWVREFSGLGPIIPESPLSCYLWHTRCQHSVFQFQNVIPYQREISRDYRLVAVCEMLNEQYTLFIQIGTLINMGGKCNYVYTCSQINVFISGLDDFITFKFLFYFPVRCKMKQYSCNKSKPGSWSLLSCNLNCILIIHLKNEERFSEWERGSVLRIGRRYARDIWSKHSTVRLTSVPPRWQ